VASPHIEHEELAQQAEGTLEPSRAAQVRAHLAGCLRCLAAYEEAVRDRAAWITTPEMFAAPAGWEKAHLGVLPPAAGGPVMSEVRSVPVRRMSPSSWAWLGGVAAALAAVFWLTLAPRNREIDVLSLPPAIRAAAEQASSQGLVLPGGESGANVKGTAFRSGGAADLGDVVSQAVDRYERDRNSSAALHAACVALVVSNRLDHAQDYIDAGLTHDPNDAVLVLLAADVAYRRSKLDVAEQRLRSALELRPHDPVATLDLGIVLAETGDTAEAKRLFDSVAKDHRGKPLGDRAAREISTLPNQGS
jgi:tetratricopeptide (TPR) repeat protein